ncbi:hypothetical protein hmeg3_09700 [Herbaspirillum sp. meg3]|uniref:hypothetical protein n=1 Tax=Herbaspirillum sp. meg3 TaxID=2025949 RepID=UPI000B98BAF3|nr:hypothetical protein [Herbaspirillum sp. meg3]ASU38544.1 hypothetical protein hmeg3_09700 [Herbaspirillum sp. meg3]
MTSKNPTPVANLSYREKLKDPKWKKVRDQIILDRGRICECCGIQGTHHPTGKPVQYEVHHGYYVYWKQPWEYEEETLWVVCDICHDKVHDSLAILQREIGMLDPIALNVQAKEVQAIKDAEIRLYLEELHSSQAMELQEALKDEYEDQLERHQYIEVVVYSSDELGPSGCQDLCDKLDQQFPGIRIIQVEDGPDCLWQVIGDPLARSDVVEEVTTWLRQNARQ